MRRARFATIAVLAAGCTVTLPFDELTDGAPRAIAHYSFEEGSGLSARDGIGSNNAIFGEDKGKAPQWTREGKRGGGLQFAVDDGWVEAPTLAESKFPQRATYAAWVRFPTAEMDGDLIEVDDDTDTEERTPIYFGVSKEGVYLVFHEGPTSAGDERSLIAPPLEAGKWMLVAAGWDIPAKQAFLYIRPEGGPARPLITGELPPNFALRAAYLIFMAGGGTLDEVRIFDRPLVVNQLDTLD